MRNENTCCLLRSSCSGYGAHPVASLQLCLCILGLDTQMLVENTACDLQRHSLPSLRSDWPGVSLAAYKGIAVLHLFLQKLFLGYSWRYLLMLPLLPALASPRHSFYLYFFGCSQSFIFRAFGRQYFFVFVFLIDIILKQEFCRWLPTHTDEDQTQRIFKVFQTKSGSDTKYLLFCHLLIVSVLCNVVNISLMANKSV